MIINGILYRSLVSFGWTYQIKSTLSGIHLGISRLNILNRVATCQEKNQRNDTGFNQVHENVRGFLDIFRCGAY